MQDPSYPGYSTKRKTVNDIVSRNEAEIQVLEENIRSIQDHEERDISNWRGFADKRVKFLQDMIERIESNTNHLIETRQSMSRYEADPIAETIKSLKRRNELHRAFAAPIAKLPNEVLSLIFEEFVDMDLCIWPLTKVSERWRRIAFSTLSIWTKILLRGPTGFYNTFEDGTEKRRFSGARHVCLNDQDLSEAILRAGACLLDVSIDYESWQSDGHNEFIASLKVLMKREVAIRVKSLDISVRNVSIATQWPEGFLSIPLEKLTNFTIHNLPQKWRENLLRSISTWTKNLRSFTNSKSGSILTLPDQVWSGMRYIDFNDNITPGEMDRLCRKISHIQSLDGLPKEWPSKSTPLFTFHSLQSISLRSEPENIRHIQWVALRKMEISDVFQPLAAIDDNFSYATFPELASLKLTSNRPHQWLLNTNMPVLATLNVQFTGIDIHPDFSGLSVRNLPMLRDLILGTSYSISSAKSLLRALPQITSLTIEPGRHEDVSLLKYLTEFGGGFTCCPNLLELQVGCSGSGTFSRKNSLIATIKRLIAAREKHSSKIRSLRVFWKLSSVAQEYIVK